MPGRTDARVDARTHGWMTRKHTASDAPGGGGIKNFRRGGAMSDVARECRELDADDVYKRRIIC